MADQPTRGTVRNAVTSAGVTSAALLLAAAAAAPALADNGDNNGDSNNGHHYGQTKDHSTGQSEEQGQTQAGGQSQSNGQSQSRGKSDSAGSSDSATQDSAPSDQDPAGNNGTVKIHDVYGDTAHHNVPHVDCDFAVAFWGFDAGQQLDVSFAGQAPTGKDTPLTVTGASTSITSPDAAGGGQDYDGELQFTADELNLSSLGDPQPQQGYHIKLTVNTYEPGGHKYKVFWLQPCTTTAAGTTQSSAATEAPATAVLGESATTQSGQSTANGATTESGTTESGATETGATSASAAGVPTEVLGEHFTRSAPGATAAPAASSLPFTGAEIGGMAAAAAIALGAGTALTVAGRRRRRPAGAVSES